ncbi:MAG: peroxidase family protein [Planctomycetota bacterium]
MKASFPLYVLALCLVASMPVAAQEFRSIDGSGNNLANPLWGSAGIELLRVAPSNYGDGVSTPAGADRPGARAVSNALCDQPAPGYNEKFASDMLWQWGQFLDHDIDLTPTHNRSAPGEVFNIPVPIGDPFFDPQGIGGAVIPLVRSLFVVGFTPRQQVNAITSFLDASNVYGSDLARAEELRTLDGSGKLKTSDGDLLPFNVNGFPNAQPPGDPASFFLAGDVRANEHVGLTAMHTLFLREHNRLAEEIALADPGLTGDEIYLRTRRIVGAQLQVITYREFLPLLLGRGALRPYGVYQASINPSIANEFSTAGYRVGHTMISGMLLRYSEGGVAIPQGNLELREAFFVPSVIVNEGGIDPILRGLISKPAEAIDVEISDDIRNFLFGPPTLGGLDLAALNVQRGRDHGLGDYNLLRSAYGLTPVIDWDEITPDPFVQNALQSMYGDIDNLDAWVTGLAEPHLPGALVGELFFHILVDQFERLRDGDRFWYQADFTPAEIQNLENTLLSDIMARNTSVASLRADVFTVPSFSRGDCNQDGVYNLADPIYIINYSFLNGDALHCEMACDANDDGNNDVADVIWGVTYLFLAGAPPFSPFPDCGPDPTAESLGCYQFDGCP